jgi:predicted acylesterase/phospholipase RssA
VSVDRHLPRAIEHVDAGAEEPMLLRNRGRTAATLVVLCLAAGCAGAPARAPVPLELIRQAAIPGVPDARFFGDATPEFVLRTLETATDAELARNFEGIYGKPHSYLAISGGGANGAYGAGFLAGWSAAGTRPEFSMVTGISTGALTAPFAFLGADYDDELKTLYTTTTTDEIAKPKGMIAGFFSEAMTDTQPLRALIERYISAEVIAAVAAEHRRGRRLWIGTANLDVGRPVIWNLGAIAASNYTEKARLIHDVLQASAAIPVAFPPVLVSVEADGRTYDEMHVDGGTSQQVFVYPAAMDWPRILGRLKAVGRPSVYVIRNAFLDADFNGVQRKVLPIASRSISSLIRTQGLGDLYQIYALCLRDNNDFKLAYIPADFIEVAAEDFDPVYMSKLYDFGYNAAMNGYDWRTTPPGFGTTSPAGAAAATAAPPVSQ